ncbi:MAG: hypothetical protein EOR74_29750 [Mesorhizobium sp.]|nr:MAG: hypothetical protein EOR74_29750 [Mesorhizobium sp.]
MRGAPAWHRRHFFQHPSTVSALRADPPRPGPHCFAASRRSLAFHRATFANQLLTPQGEKEKSPPLAP